MYTIENNFHKNNSTLDYKRPAYLSRRKQKLYNRAKRTHKTKDWNSYNAIKKLAQKKCREAYSSYINNIICSEEASPKLFWNYIKNKKNDRCGVAQLKRNGGFKLVKSFMTPLWWIIIGGISGVELTPISGMLLRSSDVKTDEN
jgi:hypothetical protein